MLSIFGSVLSIASRQPDWDAPPSWRVEPRNPPRRTDRFEAEAEERRRALGRRDPAGFE